ncbi:YibE/F family protein [Sporosarcina oncorhynchi]|uniref:YibE/F family protein n=1 Tax=Sporosarcina oncorhynchi TaxID=3056444 RepID=A0ABZ0L4F7_9BACL|nr:YibE/F family protein [Sporosarcina sp. T2O-4]WOV86803.1 YibE/F family protein [Sporosarcina sp. T2O-4]
MKFSVKKVLGYCLLLFCIILSILFVNLNYTFYDRPIAKVIETVLEETTATTDRHGNEDTLFTQHITAQMKNGPQKGMLISLQNDYSYSGAYDQEYRVGNDLFVLPDEQVAGADNLTGIITDVKRDKHALIIAWIFIFALMIVGKRQGVFAIISFALNVLILSFALDIYVNNPSVNLLLICGICILLFTCISLVFVSGFSEKTYAAIVATLVGTVASLAIALLVLRLTSDNGLRYEEMQFVTRPYRLVFIGGLFIGSLGAIMDIAITLSSSMFALYEKDRSLSRKALKESGMDIGQDIMGTITNILFLAYICGSIPMLVLSFKNGTPLGFTFSMNLSLEVTRALVGGIGIVLTIPIAVYTSLFFIDRKKARL